MNNIGLEVVFWTILALYLLTKLGVFKKNDRVKFEWGIGGEDKMNSSSWILHGYFERQKKLLGI